MQSSQVALTFLTSAEGAPARVTKVLRHVARSAQTRQLFQSDLASAPNFEHPNVRSVLVAGEHDGEPFFVEEHTEGLTLERMLLQAEKVPMPIVVAVGQALLRAIDAAHLESLGHGELGPHAIQLTTTGDVLVSGFGSHAALARFGLHYFKNLERLSYAAPSRVKAMSLTLGPPPPAPTLDTDRYSAAILLWELATKTRLFASRMEAAVVQKVQTAPIPKPETLRPEIDGALATALVKSLSRDPEGEAARGALLAAFEQAEAASSDDIAAFARKHPVVAIRSASVRPPGPPPRPEGAAKSAPEGKPIYRSRAQTLLGFGAVKPPSETGEDLPSSEQKGEPKGPPRVGPGASALGARLATPQFESTQKIGGAFLNKAQAPLGEAAPSKPTEPTDSSPRTPRPAKVEEAAASASKGESDNADVERVEVTIASAPEADVGTHAGGSDELGADAFTTEGFFDDGSQTVTSESPSSEGTPPSDGKPASTPQPSTVQTSPAKPGLSRPPPPPVRGERTGSGVRPAVPLKKPVVDDATLKGIPKSEFGKPAPIQRKSSGGLDVKAGRNLRTPAPKSVTEERSDELSPAPQAELAKLSPEELEALSKIPGEMTDTLIMGALSEGSLQVGFEARTESNEVFTVVGPSSVATFWNAESDDESPRKATILPVPKDGNDEPAVEALLRDARQSARVTHPNWISVLGVGRGADAFVVLERLSGISLRTLEARAAIHGGTPVPAALQMARDLALGLHRGHELSDEGGEFLDWMHRSLSPESIFISAEGVTQLLGFHPPMGPDPDAKPGAIKRPAHYRAPEQLAGLSVDRRSDLFALGAVFYEVLTGVHPFRSETELQTLQNIAVKAPMRLRELDADIPIALEKIIMSLLEKEPSKRPQTAEELHELLNGPDLATLGTAEDVADFLAECLGQPRPEGRPLSSRSEGPHELPGPLPAPKEPKKPVLEAVPVALAPVAAAAAVAARSEPLASAADSFDADLDVLPKRSPWFRLATLVAIGVAVGVIVIGIIELTRSPATDPTEGTGSAASSNRAQASPPVKTEPSAATPPPPAPTTEPTSEPAPTATASAEVTAEPVASSVEVAAPTATTPPKTPTTPTTKTPQGSGPRPKPTGKRPTYNPSTL